MTNAKTTRRALLTSVMSLILCCSMLLGTTFAWFTDTVTSANNIITAGNLDITLEYWDGDSWENVQKSTELFDADAKWEPGYTKVVYLKVANAGSLALKYQLGVNIVSETSSINVKGDSFKLSDYIYFDVLENIDPANGGAFATREAAMQNATETTLISAGYSKSSKLVKNGDAEYVALIVYMPETVKNDANYATGAAVPTINLGVNVLATQLNAEKDSFDQDYDKDAVFGTYVEVETGDKLLDVMASAEKDMPLTIQLNADVEWPTDSHHGENDITPASSILIIGNGYTITATGSGVTPLGDTEAPMTLKDVKIVDNSASYDENAWELSYLEIGSKVLTCENVDFADPIQVVSDAATFTDCSFVGHYDKNSTSTTQYAVWVYNGNSTYTNCSFTGTRSMKICDQYAGGEVGTVVIDGCIFNGISEKPGVVIDDRDTQEMKITIKNSTFINCQAGDQNLYIYETDNTVPTLENNTVYNNAKVIETAEELRALSAKALTENNGVTEEATIILESNIDMDGAEFSAIIAQRGDKLTIVGNGHKISNVKVVSGANDNTTGQASMFYTYPDSTLIISDLTLENITVTADANDTGYAAAIVGYCEGKAILNNVDVVNATVTGVKSSGMLVGHMNGSLEAKDCDLSGTVTLADFAEEANGHYAGKYIGTLAGKFAQSSCVANVTVSGNLKDSNDGTIYGRKVSGSLVIDDKTVVESATDLSSALANEEEVILFGDTTLSDDIGNNAVIDLNDNTLSLTGSDMPCSSDLTVTDGTLDVSAGYFDLRSTTDSEILFENVDFVNTTKSKTFGNSTNYVDSAIEIFPQSSEVTTTVTFKECTFKNSQVLIEAVSDKKGVVNVVFENCTFTNFGNAEAINIHNYLTCNVTIKNCTFDITATSNVRIVDALSSATVSVKFEGDNTIKGVAATPTTDPSLVGTVDEVKVFSSQSVKAVGSAVDVVEGLDTITVEGIATK